MRSALAIVVATRDRAPRLRRLLASCAALEGRERLAPAIVVADDGSTDDTADVVAEAAAANSSVRHLALPGGGKSRALNAAIRATTAPLLAFVDDDVELDPHWLIAMEAYAGRHDVGAAQGTIRLPPAAAGDPMTVAALARWHTIPQCDYGPTVTDATSLIGANMLVARRAFARVGLFDERLGPGAAGASEDTELAMRLRAAGERIGYVADAIVYHAVEPDRLSARYFRALHESRGRSRIYYKQREPRAPWLLALRVLPDLVLAGLGVAVGRLRGGEAERRALARWYHYRALLAAGRAPRLPGGVPRLPGGVPLDEA
jgi:GT2 family glycosyltransferase